MKPERFAQDAARFIKSLERMQGVITQAHGDTELVLLSQPEVTQLDRARVDAVLFSREPEQIGALSEVIGARQALRLDPGRLGGWLHKLHLLQRSHGLEALIRAGHGALKRYQQVDIRARIEAFVTRYELLRDLQQLLSVPEHAPLAPFLVYAPSRLPEVTSHAYRGELGEAVRRALDQVPALGITHIDVLRALHVVAGFCGEEGARSVADETHLELSYGTGVQLDTASQLAAACIPHTSQSVLGNLMRCGDATQRHWATTSYVRAAGLLGARAASAMVHRGCAELRAHHTDMLRIEARARLFLMGCRTLADDVRGGPLPEELSSLRHHTHGPALTRELARALTRALEEEGIAPEVIPSQTSLWRTVLSGTRNGHDPVEVGELLWRTVRARLDLDTSEDVISRTRKRCIITLMRPDAPIPGLERLDGKQLDALRLFLEEVPHDVADRFTRTLGKMKLDMLGRGMRRHISEARALTPQELSTILDHAVLRDHVEELPKEPKSRAALLQCVRGLDDMGLTRELELDNGWLVRLFSSEAHDHDFNVLAIATALSRTQKKDALASQIHAFCQSAQRPNSSMARALKAWRTRPDWTPEEADTIREIAGRFLPVPASDEELDAILEQIADYLHHRRRLGEPEALSKNIEKKLRDPAGGAEAQIAILSERLEREAMPMTGRLALRQKLESLERGEHPAARDKRLRAARNLLAQSLAKLESRSLQAALDDALLEVLEQMTGRAHSAEVLTQELRSVIAVSQSEEFDPELFAHFLDAALSGVPRTHLPANRAWLATARHGDMARWERGFDVRTTLGKISLRIQTEHDMMRAVHMGTWFDTCLSLTDGFHAMSALAHTLDANKHVIYVENKRGEIVARKLIGISKSGELVGFPVYTCEGISEEGIKVLVDSVVADFARECGMTMGAQGEPGEIHAVTGDGIYYDGVVPWHIDRHEHDALVKTPETWGDSVDEVLEWALMQGRTAGDVEKLKAVAWRMRDPWSKYAMAHLMTLDVDAARRWLEAHPVRWDPHATIAHALWRHVLGHQPRCLEVFTHAFRADDPWYPIDFAMWNMPLEQALVEQLCARALEVMRDLERHPRRLHDSTFEHIARNPVLLGHLAVEPLLELLEQAIVLASLRDMNESRKQEEAGYMRPLYVQALRLSWLVHGADERALAGMIRRARHIEAVRMLADFAAEAPHDATRRALWSRWKRAEMRRASASERRAVALALLAHEPSLAQSVLPAEVEVWPGAIPDADALCAFVREHDRRLASAKRERRAVMRALESTRHIYQGSLDNQIDHDEVHEAFRTLAQCEHDEVSAFIDQLAALCIISDEAQHARALKTLHELARDAARARARGEVDSLRYLAGFVHGSTGERLDAIRAEIARYKKRTHPRLGAIVWKLAHDLVGHLDPDEIATLASSCMSMNQLPYCMPIEVRAFLRWFTHHPDPERAIEAWVNESSHNLDDATDTGIVALVDALDHEEEAFREIASITVLAITRRASPWGRAEVISHIEHRIISEQGARCAALVFEQCFEEHVHPEALTPKQWIDLSFERPNWRDQLGMDLLQRLVDRAARTWSQAQRELCTTLLEERAQRKHAPSLIAYWEQLNGA